MGLNGVESQYRFGAFGRRYLAYSNDGRYALSLRSSGYLVCPGGAFAEGTNYSGGKSDGACYDVLGRPTRRVQKGFASGTAIFTDIEYDTAGRTRYVTEPYFSTLSVATQPFTSYAYDALGRVTNVKAPDGANSTASYAGLTTTSSNPAGQNTVITTNAIGELDSITDHLGGEINYGYDAEGNTTSIKTTGSDLASGVPGTITISYEYDAVGRKKSMVDPDKGSWTYAYNVLGELVTQTDAKGQTINVPLPSSGTSGYDALGRLVKRIDKKANGSVEETTTWVYDIAPNGKGQLEHVEQANSGYIKLYSYDTLGRPRTRAVALSAADGGTHYEYLGYYDQYGREYKSFDASWSGVQKEFNAQGYLSRIIDMNPAGTAGAEHYKVLSMDASGRVTSERIEDAVTRNVEYDALGRTTSIQAGNNNALQNLAYSYHGVGSQYGNLKERIDNNKGLTETFGYDGLSRLTSSQVSGQVGGQVSSQTAVTVSYDSFGNIKSKSDAGAYTYAANAGPHALTGVNGSVLTYDLNGNNTGTAGGRSIAYNTFDKPISISRAGYASNFTYGPDRDYYKRVDGPSGTKTIYFDGVEKVFKADGSGDIRRYVPGGALITQKYNSSGVLQSTNKELILKDHLGSTDVIADSNGVLKQAMNFDSWGRRRDAANWSPMALTIGFDTSRTAKGYTGHEMVDDVDVVHMHGRIYDPRWGRMLQADPYIQDGSDSQAFNRFAYVNNNPLIHTDPSGYSMDELTTANATITAMMMASGSYSCYGSCITFSGGGGSGGVSAAGAGVNISVNVGVGLLFSGLDGGSGYSGLGVGANQLHLPTDFNFDVDIGLELALDSSTERLMPNPLRTSAWGIIHSVETFGSRSLGMTPWSKDDPRLVETVETTARINYYDDIGPQKDITWSQRDGQMGRALTQFGAIGVGSGVAGTAGVVGRVALVKSVPQAADEIVNGAQVTDKMLREALKDAPLSSQQRGGLSLPRVQSYVDKLLSGEKAPPIKVDGKMIVDGNHRYAAGRVLGKEPPVQPWTGGRPGNAVKWEDIPISPEAW